jgi:hypothetical protein
MHAPPVQFTGEIGPFLDTVQQRQVSVVVLGSCKYASMGAPGSQAQMEQQIQAQMLRAIHETIAPKMASGQLSFKDLGTGNTSAIIPEIFARSGLAQAGIAVDKLLMSFGIDGRPPQPLPQPLAPAPQAIVPQQVNVRVGGFNVRASADGGIDTAGLKNQMVDKVKSTILWYLFFAGAVIVVLGAVGAYGYYVYKHPPVPAAGNAPPGAAKPPPPPPPAKTR